MNRLNAFEYLWSLPVEERNFVYMFYYENMPYHEIAASLFLEFNQVAKKMYKIQSSFI